MGTLSFINLLRCCGREDDLSQFWSNVLVDEYGEGVTIFRMKGYGIGILTSPQRGNSITFESEESPTEGLETLSKDYPNIRFECCVDDCDIGEYETYIYQNGLRYSAMEFAGDTDWLFGEEDPDVFEIPSRLLDATVREYNKSLLAA